MQSLTIKTSALSYSQKMHIYTVVTHADIYNHVEKQKIHVRKKGNFSLCFHTKLKYSTTFTLCRPQWSLRADQGVEQPPVQPPASPQLRGQSCPWCPWQRHRGYGGAESPEIRELNLQQVNTFLYILYI